MYQHGREAHFAHGGGTCSPDPTGDRAAIAPTAMDHDGTRCRLPPRRSLLRYEMKDECVDRDRAATQPEWSTHAALQLPWSVFANAQDPAIVLQAIHQQPLIAMMNSAFTALIGSHFDGALGRPWDLLFTPATRDVATDALRSLNHEPVRREVALRMAFPGTETPVELELIPLADRAGGDCCLVILRDLSDHRNAIKQAARSAERLRLATDVGRIGTWEWNPQTGELVWDELLRSILGVSSTVPASHHLWSTLVDPHDRVGAARDARALLSGALDEYDTTYRIRRPDGSVRHVLARSRVSERDDRGDATQLLGMLLDITELQKAAEEREDLLRAERAARAVAEQAGAEIARMAEIDPLTGLANRTELHRWIAGALCRDERVAVLYFDLDHFKVVNDSYGHSVGDAVLIELAHRLRNKVRDGALLACFGGDEYIVATIVESPREATALA